MNIEAIETMIDSSFVHNVLLIFLCRHKLTYPFNSPRQNELTHLLFQWCHIRMMYVH